MSLPPLFLFRGIHEKSIRLTNFISPDILAELPEAGHQDPEDFCPSKPGTRPTIIVLSNQIFSTFDLEALSDLLLILLSSTHIHLSSL